MARRLRWIAAVAATSATAALAGGVWPAPAGASGGGLSAPVIHEAFTPLPCTGSPSSRSTADQEGCAEQQILKSDRTIDALNRSIFAKLATVSARRDFIAGHTAWFAYRTAFCQSESDVFQGGTEAGVLDALCAANLDAQHVGNLKDLLTDLRSND